MGYKQINDCIAASLGSKLTWSSFLLLPPGRSGVLADILYLYPKSGEGVGEVDSILYCS